VVQTEVTSLLSDVFCSVFDPSELTDPATQTADWLRGCDDRTRTDRIGAGDYIGGNFMARQYTRPTRQSYRNDHRHVGVVPATSSINTPDWCAEQVRTRLSCDLTLFCSADTDFVAACTPALKLVMNNACKSGFFPNQICCECFNGFPLIRFVPSLSDRDKCSERLQVEV
jgi:hypothetical protein